MEQKYKTAIIAAVATTAAAGLAYAGYRFFLKKRVSASAKEFLASKEVEAQPTEVETPVKVSISSMSEARIKEILLGLKPEEAKEAVDEHLDVSIEDYVDLRVKKIQEEFGEDSVNPGILTQYLKTLMSLTQDVAKKEGIHLGSSLADPILKGHLSILSLAITYE